MTVFLRLLLAHFLADFVLHRQKLFELKSNKPFLGYGLHGLTFFIVAVALCFDYLHLPWLDFGVFALNGWVMLALASLLHGAFDMLNSSDRMKSERYNTVLFVLWQTVEISLLFLIFPYVPSSPLHFNNFLIILNGALFVAYFIMVLLHYLRVDIATEDCNPAFEESYAAMLYRIILYFLVLAPGFWGYGLGAAWVGFCAYTKGGGIIDVNPRCFWTGTVLTFLTALIVRLFFYYL